MSWRCCVSRLKRVSYEYNLQSVVDLTRLTALVARLEVRVKERSREPSRLGRL
jgi:hypothetical protein